jgi:ubiquinone/menaquinone biosynthesis C-methylase UbiE
MKRWKKCAPTAKKNRGVEANRKYHDRVAGKYDSVYSGERWEIWETITWAGLKPHLPRDLNAPIADLGCGTGRFGLRAAKSGYRVLLSDLSPKMVEAARKRADALRLTARCAFLIADVTDLSALSANQYALVMAQGDVLSFAGNPDQAMREIRRILLPGGILSASVDQTFAGLAHYIEKTDWAGLEKLAAHHQMEWLTQNTAERFPVHTFTAESLRSRMEYAGFEVLDLFGKTILPFRKMESACADAELRSRLLALEQQLCRKPSALGLASHLQVTVRKPG